MLKYLVRRVLALIPTLLLVCFISFAMVEFAPGDPATSLAGENASPQDIATLREALGLNKPFLTRFVTYVRHAATGDLGSSLRNSQHVMRTILDRSSTTFSLMAAALFLAVLLGIPVGIYSAIRQGSFIDRITSVLTAGALAIPTFLISIFLLKWMALDRSWFPPTGYSPVGDGLLEWMKHLFLPGLSLALFPASELARFVRASVAETLGRDYIQTARAKGLLERQVIVKHCLKNSAVPIVTILGLQTGRLLGGAVIVETIFGLSGLGNLVVDAVGARDVPIIQGLVLFSAVIVAVINLTVDMSYGYFNPRLRS